MIGNIGVMEEGRMFDGISDEQFKAAISLDRC
jgi:hypothetical protein